MQGYLPFPEPDVHPVRDHPFHFYAPDWDDRAVEAAVNIRVNQGASVPEWRYPVPGPYNGASGWMRVRGWQKVQIAARVGLIPWPKKCSICGTTHGRIQYHNENYYRPLNVRPICPSCHMTLHRRMRKPGPWLALVNANKFAGAWFLGIGLYEMTREQALFLSTQPNPMDYSLLR